MRALDAGGCFAAEERQMAPSLGAQRPGRLEMSTLLLLNCSKIFSYRASFPRRLTLDFSQVRGHRGRVLVTGGARASGLNSKSIFSKTKGDIEKLCSIFSSYFGV